MQDPIEPVVIRLSGVPPGTSVMRLMFLYAVIRGREGVSECDFEPNLLKACSWHLATCGECQEGLRASGLLSLADMAAQAIVEVTAQMMVVEPSLREQAAQALIEVSGTLGSLRDQILTAQSSLTVQLEIAEVFRLHIEYLLEHQEESDQ